MSIYKVGIMSNVALVEAPSAMAAAFYYGGHTDGNMLCGAVVYEQDGKDYDRPMPWLSWLFGSKEPTEADIAQLKAEIPQCRFIEEGEGSGPQ